ncbi:MAG TPA: hypothetical protein VH392_09395 [Sphingomicrobium sp.]|jgi:hypothetical protein
MMVLLALVAVASATPPDRAPTPAVGHATASVRIVSGVRLKLDSPTNPDAPPAHDSTVTTDGKEQPARLIEFE